MASNAKIPIIDCGDTIQATVGWTFNSSQISAVEMGADTARSKNGDGEWLIIARG